MKTSRITATVINSFKCVFLSLSPKNRRGRRSRDRMVVGFTTTCAISAYHHKKCEFESHPWIGVERGGALNTLI